MNNITDLVQANNEQTMSSKEIAELTGKLHKNVLRDIKSLNESYEKLGEIKIELTLKIKKLGAVKRETPVANLTKMQCFDLLTGYNAELRIKVNRRWAELEAEKQQNNFQIPQTFSEALMLAAKLEEERQLALHTVKEQNEQLAIQAPKVELANTLLDSDGAIAIGNFAKASGLMGQNKMFEWFRDNGVFMTKGDRRNTPYQKWLDCGYFEVIEKPFTNKSYSGIKIKTLITPKGQEYFLDKIKEI